MMLSSNLREQPLATAIAAQSAAVQAQPNDLAGRLLLAELHTFAGQWADAEAELAHLPGDDPSWQPFVEHYRSILRAEQHRQRLFHANDEPSLIIAPNEELQARLQALRAWQQGDSQGVIDALDYAESLAEWLYGHVNGREFDGLRDADELYATTLEVFLAGECVWLPLSEIWSLRLLPMTTLWEEMYRQAEVTLRDRSTLTVVLPTRYIDSHTHAEAEIQWGLDADWTDEHGPIRGWGARLWLIDDEELTLRDFEQLDIRQRGF